MLSWSEIERVNMIISRKFESGRSMVEMMGYMAIAIVLTASVGQLVYKAFNDYKFSKASIQLTELANVISRAGAIEPSYDNVVAMISGTSERALDNQEGRKMIPSSFRVSNIAGARRIYHAFGGLVTLGSTNPEDSLNAGAKFMITFFYCYRINKIIHTNLTYIIITIIIIIDVCINNVFIIIICIIIHFN